LRCLLITPENRFIRAFRRGQLNNFAQLTMPYLAAFVRRPHTVTLVDEYAQRIDLDAPADLVGITCNTPNAPHVYALADAFRARGRMVVLGGPHPTLLPEEARPHADALVIGEAETTWPLLLADAARGALRPEYRAAEPPSLAHLPLPRRDLIAGHGLLANAVIATRGCPHRCSYCNLRQIYSPTLRFRPVEEVVAEIRGMRSPLFAFWDDQLFMDAGYARRLFAGIEGLSRQWAAMVTEASARDEKLLAAAARAGCVCLFLGLESFSAQNLKMVGKSFNGVDSYANAVERIHAHGIAVQAGLVFGFDGDDETCFEKTLKEATRIGLDGATVSILTPFPGTSLFHQLDEAGRLLTKDWSYFNGKTAVAFQPALMSPETLWNGTLWFRRQFFSRRCILERLERSGVRTLQSFALNWGYRRAVGNVLPGWPIPGGVRSRAVEWVRSSGFTTRAAYEPDRLGTGSVLPSQPGRRSMARPAP
jgi:radical SAM superfamily enzyme YgiQ (UPF0313 family)